MNLSLKLNTLKGEVDGSIKYFQHKHTKTKIRAQVIKITSVTFSALITVVLGVNAGNLSEVFRNIAIVLGAVVTIINAVDAFYNYGALWVKNALTLAKLKELKRELEFYSAGCVPEDISQDKLNKYMNQLQKILKDDIKQWLRIRERVNSADQGKEETKISDIKILPDSYRNEESKEEDE